MNTSLGQHPGRSLTVVGLACLALLTSVLSVVLHRVEGAATVVVAIIALSTLGGFMCRLIAGGLQPITRTHE